MMSNANLGKSFDDDVPPKPKTSFSWHKVCDFIHIVCNSKKHKLLTPENKPSWEEFRRLLMYRANFCMIGSMIRTLVGLAAGWSDMQRGKEYMESF